MDAIIKDVNTTAMVIGYPVMAVIIFLILWFGTRLFRDICKIFDEMRYERWKRKHAERDWDNIEASWMLELPEDEYEPQIPTQREWNKHDTDVFPTLELQDQLYNFQEERYERP